MQTPLSSPVEPAASVPLCVDLDGTLARTDLLHEAAVRYIKSSPFALLHILWWLLQGKAKLKQNLAERVTMRFDLLPLRADLCAFLQSERTAGRDVHLVTASPQVWGEQVAAPLGLFATVTGSNGVGHGGASLHGVNLKGRAKADLLIATHGSGGFDYVGDHAADLLVWQGARVAHFAGPASAGLARRLTGAVPGQTFDTRGRSRLSALLKAARPQQWLKNLLLFVSLAAAHALLNLGALLHVMIAFVSFSLLASATYMINDLLDLDSDRAHPRKRNRPFASGDASIADGVLAIVALSAIAIGLALLLPPLFLPALGIYAVTTLAYSFRLKRAVLIDVITLAALYTLRIIAGTIAAGIPTSTWLLAFSMFCFMTLAIAKRCAELTGTQVEGGAKIGGRGYYGSDIEVIASMGAASSFCASLVLCIYTTQHYVAERYASPAILWLLCPVLLYLLNRILILARRGHMDDDPIVFCVRDRVTQQLGLLAVAVVVAATFITIPINLIVVE